MELGQRVRVVSVMYRTIPPGKPSNWRVWVSRPLRREVVGVFVGYRWRQNGNICGGYGSDDPAYFVERYPRTKVALVCVDKWTAPLVADPQRCQPVSD